MTLMELTAILSLDSSGFNKGLSSANALAKGFAVKAVDNILKVSKSLVKTGFEYNKEMETMQTSFKTMTGSAEEASAIVERLKTMAAETPFESKDLAKTTQLLMQYGFTADDAIDKMEMLGDIAQGNAQAMNSVATGYAQMHSAGKVNLQDIKQMINAGFNPLQEISERTGESMESLYDRISKGKMSVDEITESMIYATSEGGKFFKSMENQSETMSGQLSTLSENWNSFAGGLIAPITENLQGKVLPAINDSMQEISDAIFDVGEEISDASPWEKFADSAGNVAVDAIEKLTGFITDLSSNWDANKDTVKGIALGLGAIWFAVSPGTATLAALPIAISEIVANWDTVKEKFEAIKGIVDDVIYKITHPGELVADAWDTLINGYEDSPALAPLTERAGGAGGAGSSKGAGRNSGGISLPDPEYFGMAATGSGEISSNLASADASAASLTSNVDSLVDASENAGSAFDGFVSSAAAAESETNDLLGKIEKLFSYDGQSVDIGVNYSSNGSPSLPGRAVGIDYVPYNGYAAALHEGEMVLTKLEAERFRKNEERGLNSTSGNYGATAGEIASAVAAALMNVGIDIDGKRAGRLMRKGSSSAQNDYSKSLARGYGY